MKIIIDNANEEVIEITNSINTDEEINKEDYDKLLINIIELDKQIKRKGLMFLLKLILNENILDSEEEHILRKLIDMLSQSNIKVNDKHINDEIFSYLLSISILFANDENRKKIIDIIENQKINLI
ncbi:MAG: hypothetical protein N2505_00425 [Endomicrobia bacterium]|nr:hypothetical protein [Endomicrobiia bacterium]